MVDDIEAFSAGVSFTSGIVLVRFDFHHAVVLYQNFKPAVLGAENACGFVPLAHHLSPTEDYYIYLKT